MPKLKTKTHHYPVYPEIASKIEEIDGVARRVFEEELADTTCQVCGWKGFDSQLERSDSKNAICPSCKSGAFITEIEYAVIDGTLCEQIEVLTHDITIPLEVGESVSGNIKEHLEEGPLVGFQVFKTSVKRYFEGEFEITSEGNFSYEPLSDWFGKDTVHVAVSFDGYEALLAINFAVRISEEIE